MNRKDKAVSRINSAKTGQKTLQETEDQMKNPRHWFEFYGEKLHKFWKDKKAEGRTLEGLYLLMGKLSDGHTDNAISTIKNKFIREKSLTKELIPAAAVLLLETDFYSQFFDIGMLHRLDKQNTEKQSRTSYDLLKIKSADKTDIIWNRWLNLFREKYIEPENTEKFYSVESGKTDSKEIIDLMERLRKEESDLYEIINFRKDVIDRFYKLSVIFHYRSFLHSELFRKDIENNDRKRKGPEIDLLLNEADRLLDDLEKYSSRPEFGEFYEDFRLYRNYQTGNHMFGTAVFKDLSQKEQKTELERKKKYMEIMLPREDDSHTYSIWYNYYNFHYLQNRMDYFMNSGSLEKGLEECEKCIQLLKALDGKLKGGFLRLSLKIKYNLRILYLIYYSVEAMIQERSVGLSIDGTEYEKEGLSEKRDRTVMDILEWLRSIKK
ncbi:MAG TPA: hypothetical protein PL163_19195 [Leptospiraceae bacterium]|nr:hypothetical protein [Leptospiraceae bacterium]